MQGSKQYLLLWAARGDHALRCTIGIDDQGLLYTSQALRQEVHPNRQVVLLEPKQHDADQQQGQKAVQGMDREFAIRPVIGRPPQGPCSWRRPPQCPQREAQASQHGQKEACADCNMMLSRYKWPTR